MSYDYIMDAADTNQTGIFTALATGPHDIEIIDTKGCTKDTSIVINSPPPITVTTTITHVTTCYDSATGEIMIVAGGGTGAKQYSFEGSAFTADTILGSERQLTPRVNRASPAWRTASK